MGSITDQINTAFRDFVTDGVASSGAHEVVKSEVRAVGPLIEAAVTNIGLGALVDVIKETKALLDADLAHAADTIALVYGDATDANNDLYIKVGASGAGSWTNTGAFHGIAESLVEPYVDSLEALLASFNAGYPEISLTLASEPRTDKFVEGSGAVTPSAYRSYSFTSGTVYTLTAIAKAGERRFMNLFCNGGALIDATFDLEAGTVAAVGASNTAAIKALGRGWYLCRVTRTATATDSANVQVRMGTASSTFSYTGDGASGLYVGLVSFVVNGTVTELFPARFISDASFTKLTSTVAAVTLALDPVVPKVEELESIINGANPTKFTEASGGAVSPAVYKSFSYTAGKTYKAWAVVKADERTRFNIYANGGFIPNATFDLATGAASGSGSSITPRGNGEYLCEVTLVAGTTASSNLQLRVFPASGGHPYVGDGTSGLHVLSAGLYEDGVAINTSSADDLVSTLWTKQNVTVAIDTGVQFGSLEARINALEGGAVSGSALQGKKWAAIGTSITEQNQYFGQLETLSGMDGTNLGASGGSIASGSHYGSLYLYDEIPNIPADTEIVTIEAGINDFGTSNSDLGALGDTTTATFYGALYASVVAIRAQAPNAKIIFFTPYSGGAGTATHRIGVTNSKGLKLEQFQDAVVKSANYLGYPVIDVGRESGINYFTASTYTSDDLHINALGGTRYANYVLRKMLDLFAAGFFGS